MKHCLITRFTTTNTNPDQVKTLSHYKTYYLVIINLNPNPQVKKLSHYKTYYWVLINLNPNPLVKNIAL